jgi:hypothetical protein
MYGMHDEVNELLGRCLHQHLGVCINIWVHVLMFWVDVLFCSDVLFWVNLLFCFEVLPQLDAYFCCIVHATRRT